MGARTVRQLRALSALLAFVLLAGQAACSADLPALVRREGLAGAAVVRLDPELAVAARARGRRVEVIAFRRDGSEWAGQVIAGSTIDQPAANSVRIFGYEGETGEAWNTFVYGTAEPAVSRVVLDGPPGAGGGVVGGAWVIALRDRGVQPGALRWRFVDAAGAVVTSGTGIRP